MTITEDNRIYIDGVYMGEFKSLQRTVEYFAPEIIQKHKIKAVYLGGNSMRWIADWEGAFREFFGK